MLRIAFVLLSALTFAGCGLIDHVRSVWGSSAVRDKPDAAAWRQHVPWDNSGPGVVKTGTGLEYVVLARGAKAGAQADATSMVEIHYEGRLNAGGKTFDSSFERGETARFPVGGVIPGFSEALRAMRPGDAWLVYIPSRLGYGERGAGGDIPPNADLVFEIEMKRVIVPPASDVAAWSKFVPWTGAASGLLKTASGLEYVVLASGPAKGAHPHAGQSIDVYLEGRPSAGGIAVVSTFAAGEPVSLAIDELTAGFAEAMKLMRPGDRWMVLVPPEQAGDDAPAEGGVVYEVLLDAVR